MSSRIQGFDVMDVSTPVTLQVRPPMWRHWREEDVETAFERRLLARSTLKVRRQVLCCPRRPDSVCADVVVSDDWQAPTRVVVCELKRDPIGHRALAQLTRYVEHFTRSDHPWWPAEIVMGLLVGPSIVEDLALPPWCSFLPIVIRGRTG